MSISPLPAEVRDAAPSIEPEELRGISRTVAEIHWLLLILLVAHIVTMFSADIRYGLNRAKLLSETDELTGLLNMRGFSIAANRLFGQALRADRAMYRAKQQGRSRVVQFEPSAA